MSHANQKFMGTLRRLLRPLVRLLIKRNIPLQAIIGELKSLYVHEAEHMLTAAQEKLSDSRISLMTGVHRKDVKWLRDKSIDIGETPLPVSTGGELMARWLATPAYYDAAGEPRQLLYKSDDAVQPTFTSLAESVSKDIRPRALLDDLISQRVVVYDEIRNTVTLLRDAFLPQKGFDEKVHYLGLNNGDHLEAAVTNMLSEAPPFLDRSVYHDGLTQRSAEELKKIATEEGMRLLRHLNRKAFDISEQDKDKPDAHYRINFGTYFFSADTRADNQTDDKA